MRRLPNSHLLLISKLYAGFVALFLIAKPCFMLSQSPAMRKGCTLADLPAVWWHGLPLDLATAGYLTAPLWLMLGISIWVRIPRIKLIYNLYAVIVSIVLAVVWVADACLYSFWGIKLDGTVWNYVGNPQGALDSVSGLYATGVAAAILALGTAAFFFLKRLFPETLPACRHRATLTVVWILAGGLLFLGIRGGIGKSTANVGSVYYSEKQFLNHSAVNPVFSIFSSLLIRKHDGSKYRYLDEGTRQATFDSLGYRTTSVQPDTLLRTPRPNVLLILMEGCGGTFVHAIDSLAPADITPNLNRLAREGVLFSQCYANSFRTDRGTLSTLSGFPAYPDLSVMKQPSLYPRLPGIAHTLRKAGYSTEFLYGGDINFTNTHGYLMATGYEHTYGDTSFPASVRRTHDWGVTDRIAFDRLLEMVKAYPADRPWHLAFLTLASHEPWGVPYHRIPTDEKANAMAYLDDCIGRFIARLRRTPLWDNTLVILLPDHGINYPEGIGDDDPRRSHIPLIWTGGAVRAPRTIPLIMNQSDLAATLLGQLRLPHDDFRFSRDVLSRDYTRPCALHTWSEGIYFKDTTGITAINVLTSPPRILRDEPEASAFRVRAAKAFLQTSYQALE